MNIKEIKNRLELFFLIFSYLNEIIKEVKVNQDDLLANKILLTCLIKCLSVKL